MTIKCNNKVTCGSKITMRVGDRKQRIYNRWLNLETRGVTAPLAPTPKSAPDHALHAGKF